MTFFITMLVDNLIKVLSFTLINKVRVGCINLCGWSRVRVLSFILFFFQVFLLFFPSLLGGFYTLIVIVWNWSLGLLDHKLRFSVARVLYSICLGPNFGCSSIDQIVFWLILIVYFSDITGRLEARLGLGLNKFVNNLFLGTKFSPLLLCLSFNQELETFFKKLNKIWLFSGSVSLKF